MKSWLNIFSGVEFVGILFSGFSFVLFVAYMQYHTMGAELYLELESDQQGVLQVYWRQASENYSEKNSNKIAIGTSATKYSISIPTLINIDYLRIDPIDKSASLKIKAVKLQFPRVEAVDLLVHIDNPDITQLHLLELHRQDGEMLISALEDDANFVLHLPFADYIDCEWQQLLTGMIFVTMLLSLILSQKLLNGRKGMGVLQVTFPVKTLLQLPVNLGAFCDVHPRIVKNEQQDESRYILKIIHIEPHQVGRLIQSVKRENSEAVIRFQYNRSCEV